MSAVRAGPLLLPNFGAEEDLDWRLLLAQPFYRRLAILWSLLFPPSVRVKGVDPAALRCIPESLASGDELPIVGLADAEAGIPWLSTSAAWESLSRAGYRPMGAPPEVAWRYHDKGHTRRRASALGLDPPEIRDCFHVFEPSDLADLNRFLDLLGALLKQWPDWARKRWTLKPRFGLGGRGRIPGVECETPVGLHGSLARLARRGGAVLEPFFERVADYSAHWIVRSPTEIEPLGTMEQWGTTSGSYLGHRGNWDPQTKLPSTPAADGRLVQSAEEIVREAARDGFLGPCAVDFFSLRHEGKVLHRLCEFNARYTVGTIVVGLLYRTARMPEVRALDKPTFEFSLASTMPLPGPQDRSSIVIPLLQEDSEPPLLRYLPTQDAAAPHRV